MTQFSGDYRNLPCSASNTRKPAICKTLSQCCLTALIPFSCTIYHPKFAHDPYHLLGAETLTVPLCSPFPACAPADLLSFSSLLLFLLIAILPLRKYLCHSPNLANLFCMKYGESSEKSGGGMKTDRGMENLSELHFSVLPLLGAVMGLPMFILSTRKYLQSHQVSLECNHTLINPLSNSKSFVFRCYVFWFQAGQNRSAKGLWE